MVWSRLCNVLLVTLGILVVLACHANAQTTCAARTKACGEFEKPDDVAGNFTCSFSKKYCSHRCHLLCHNGMSVNDAWTTTFVCHRPVKAWISKYGTIPFCKATKNVDYVRQKLTHHNVDKLNRLAYSLLNSSYYFLGMATFYDRADITLPGFGKYMTHQWSEGMGKVKEVMQYVNKRGGYISLYELPRPSSYEQLMLSTKPGLTGMKMVLETTKNINAEALLIRKKVGKLDPNLKHFLNSQLITKHVAKIKAIANHVTRLEEFPEEDYTLGEYMFDTELDH